VVIERPVGWREDSQSFDDGSSAGIVVGSKGITPSSQNSGNISVTGAVAAWVMWQIEILAPFESIPNLLLVMG
jgi:hypothetical protein